MKAKTLGQIAYEARPRVTRWEDQLEDMRIAYEIEAKAVEKAVKRRLQRQFQKANRSGANLPQFWRDACR